MMRLTNAVTATNSKTTYGVNTSVANNYGLGTSFRSTTTHARDKQAADASPSKWWLAAALFIILVVL